VLNGREQRLQNKRDGAPKGIRTVTEKTPPHLPAKSPTFHRVRGRGERSDIRTSAEVTMDPFGPLGLDLPRLEGGFSDRYNGVDGT